MTHRHPQRMLSGLLGLLLLLPLLAACGGSAPEPSGQATSAPAGEATSAATTADSTEAPATAEETAAAEATAAEETAPAAADDGEEKTMIIGYNQAPDTLMSLISSSSIVNIVGQFYNPACVTSLDYEFQPICFDEFPSLENGGLVSETVTIEAADVSPETPILIDGVLITDSAQISQTLELPQLRATWTLKEGITWSDGEPLTSDDFVFTHNLKKDPATPVTLRYTLDRSVGLEKVDDLSFTWTGIPGFVDPTYFLNFAVDDSSYAVYPEHILSEVAPAEIANSEYATTMPVGWGPFMVESFDPTSDMTLVRNPNYFRASEGLPKLDRVVIKFISDEDQVLAQLTNGDIDVGGTIGLTLNSADSLDELAAAGTHEVQYVPATVWEHIDFGIQRGDGQESFFTDARVRQAVAFGINRQQIVDEVLGGRTKVMNTYQPDDYWAFPEAGELEEYAYDPDRAAQLLDEAGWTVGSDGIREKDGRKFAISMYTTQGNRTRESVSQIIQANLREVGIDVSLEFVPATEVLFKQGADGILYGRRFDMALYAWVAGAEPSTNLYFCETIPTEANNYGGQNSPGYCDAEYDAVGKQVYNRLTREERIPLIIESLIKFNQDLPALPLYQRVQVAAFRTGVTGVDINPSSFPDFSFPEQLDITLE